MLNEKDFELIERYLDGDLEQEELKVFEDRLAEDKELESKLMEQKSIIETYRNSQRDELKSELKSVVSKLEIAKNEKRSKSDYYKIAASISLFVIGLAAIYFFILSPKGKTPNEIFLAYYEPYPVSPIARNSEDRTSEGLLFYQTGNFEASIPYLLEQADLNDAENEYNLALGSALLASGSYEDAIKWFKVNSNSKDQLISYHSEWYIALCYLKKDSKSSIGFFMEIVNSESPYKEYSKKILGDLEVGK